MKKYCPTCDCHSADRRHRRLRDKMMFQRRYTCKECSTVYSVTLGMFRRTLSRGFHSTIAPKA